MAAVGEAGGGGGGGGGGAAFLWHALIMRTAHNAVTVAIVFKVCGFMLMLFTVSLFTFDPPANPNSFSSSDEVFYFQLQFGWVLRPVKVS
jgi:hypothetical protein